jgi:hypothetical protein
VNRAARAQSLAALEFRAKLSSFIVSVVLAVCEKGKGREGHVVGDCSIMRSFITYNFIEYFYVKNDGGLSGRSM